MALASADNAVAVDIHVPTEDESLVDGGSVGDPEIPKESNLSIGFTEWRHEIKAQMSDDQDKLNAFTPQYKALKDAITE